MLSVNMSIVYMIINLVILFLIFRFILFKRVDRILRLREEEMEKVKAEAEAVKKEAEEAKEKYEKRYIELEAEKEAVFASTKKVAYGVRERILNEAKQQADDMIEKAKVSADDAYNRERTKNEDAVAEMVLVTASKITAATRDAKADKALYDKFIRSAIDELPFGEDI